VRLKSKDRLFSCNISVGAQSSDLKLTKWKADDVQADFVSEPSSRLLKPYSHTWDAVPQLPRAQNPVPARLTFCQFSLLWIKLLGKLHFLGRFSEVSPLQPSFTQRNKFQECDSLFLEFWVTTLWWAWNLKCKPTVIHWLVICPLFRPIPTNPFMASTVPSASASHSASLATSDRSQHIIRWDSKWGTKTPNTTGSEAQNNRKYL
jgi:hypothetical protein